MNAPATAVEVSTNRKIGLCSATYASQHSCPPSCPLRGKGCYAEYGMMSWTTRRLNKSTITQAVKIAMAEARSIDRLSGGRDLRLHVVGDSFSRRGTRAIAAACRRYVKRGRHAPPRRLGERKVWTYTHAWRKIVRNDWQDVSVLASCENAAQVKEARRLGYATALVVDVFQSDKAYEIDGVKVIPCPNMVTGATCYDCRLCMDDKKLIAREMTIAFAAHGSGTNQVKRAIALPMA